MLVRTLTAFVALAGAALVAPGHAAAQDGVYRPQPSQLEQECQNSRRLEICLQYHTLFCQQFGIPAACRLAQIGSACPAGDQNGCNYYAQLVNTGLDCELYGNQQACAWMQAHPF